MYKGTEKVDGSYFSVGDNKQDRRPFKAYLDVGLIRTTTGNRVFGAMKGASDGGLHIPHKNKRFPGFHVEKAQIITSKRGKVQEVEKAKSAFDAKEHKEHIFGGHVEKYFNLLKEESAQKFDKQFSGWQKALGGQTFEALYTKVHKAIRTDPTIRVAKRGGKTRTVTDAKNVGYKILTDSKKRSWIKHVKLTHAERAARVEKKVQLTEMVYGQ